MSKTGRHCRHWHHWRIFRQYGRWPEIVIREMFEFSTPLTVMAGALGISYAEMHEWVRELRLEREPIQPLNRHLAKERIRAEYDHDPVALICSDRKMGMTYREIRTKYGVSAGFVADCLREGAPWLIGDAISPVRVGPNRLSNEERQRQRERCRQHNRRMKIANVGWFADHALLFAHKGDPQRFADVAVRESI